MSKTNPANQPPPKGEPKMSEVLLDFAKPLLPDDATPEEYHVAIPMAAAVWNACLQPDAEREKLRDEMAVKFGHGDPHHMVFFLNAFEAMLKQKRELYPNLRRLIVDYEIGLTDQGVTLNVTSAPMVQPPPPKPA